MKDTLIRILKKHSKGLTVKRFKSMLPGNTYAEISKTLKQLVKDNKVDLLVVNEKETAAYMGLRRGSELFILKGWDS